MLVSDIKEGATYRGARGEQADVLKISWTTDTVVVKFYWEGLDGNHHWGLGTFADWAVAEEGVGLDEQASPVFLHSH